MVEESIESRVARLFQTGGRTEIELRRAITYADIDPKSSLTKSRIILEELLNELYQKEMKSQPKRSMIGSILQEKQFSSRIDKRILARMNSVRELGNLGPHHESETVLPVDAKRVLIDLCEILEWHQIKYKSKKRNHPEKYVISGTLLDKVHRVEKIFVPPLSFDAVRQLIEAKELVIILGAAHLGKTSLALYLGNLLKKNRIVQEFLAFPKDGSINEITDFSDIAILFDDPFGGARYDRTLSLIGEDFDWIREFSHKNGNYVIMTSRKEIFDEALFDTKLGERNDLHNYIVNIEPQDYSQKEKESILYNHINYYGSSEAEQELISENKKQIIKSLDFPHSYQVFIRDGLRMILGGEKSLTDVLDEVKEIEKVIGRWFVSFYGQDKESFCFLLTLALFPDTTPDIFTTIQKLVIEQIRKYRGLDISYSGVHDLPRFIKKTASYVSLDYTIGFDHPSYREGILSKVKEDFRGDLVAIIPCCEQLANDNTLVLHQLSISCLQEIVSILPTQVLPILQRLMVSDWRRQGRSGQALYEFGQTMPDLVLPLFVDLVRHDNFAVRDEALRFLGDLGVYHPDKVMPILLDWTQNESEHEMKIHAINSLEKILNSKFTLVWPYFERWSQDEDWVVRRMVAICLRNAVKEHENDILPILANLSEDKEWMVRRAADLALESFAKNQLTIASTRTLPA